MLKLEQHIIDSSASIKYPKNFNELEFDWAKLLLEGWTKYKIKPLSDSKKEELYLSTFPIMLLKNKEAIKQELKNFVNLLSESTIKNSILHSTVNEFGIFLTSEIDSFENLLGQKVSQYNEMVTDIIGKKFKYLEKYLKRIDSFLLTENFPICLEYRNLITSIFWEYQNSEFFSKLLLRRHDNQRNEFNQFLIRIIEEINAKKLIYLKEIPNKVFDRYFNWYLKQYQLIWTSELKKRDLIIEQNFINTSEEIIYDIISGDLKLFDDTLCSEMLKKNLLNILIKLIPDKLESQDEKLQILIKSLGGDKNIQKELKFKEKSSIASSLETYWELTNEKTTYFIIICFAISIMNNKEPYTAVHRQLLKLLICHLLYPLSKCTTPLLQFLEYQIPLISDNYPNSPIVFYTENQKPIGSKKIKLIGKNKSLKLIDIHKQKTAACLIIVPGTLKDIEKMNENYRNLLKRPWNSKSFIYKWNSSLSISINTADSSGFSLAFINPFNVNFLNVTKNVLGALTKINFELVKSKAKYAGICLAECIEREEYFKNYPVCMFGEDEGCEVIFYCLKQLSKKGIFVHDVIFLGGVKKKPDSWRISLEAVAGRIINCYTSSFNSFAWLAQGNISGPLKFENHEIELYDISDISKDYSKILSLINY